MGAPFSETVFGSIAKCRLLIILHQWKASHLSERELSRLTGLSLSAIQYALRELESNLIVTKTRIGRSSIWAFNTNHYAFRQLAKILEFLSTIPSPKSFAKKKLRGLVKSVGGIPVKSLVLFGSSTGESSPGDFDIAVILSSEGTSHVIEENRALVRQRLSSISSLLGKKMDILVFTPKEWGRIQKSPLGESIRKGEVIYP